jgi:hopene-associated glycosyltransferase HpnB
VLATVPLVIWLWLLLARGGFWRVTLAPPAPAPAHWPDVIAVVPARDEAGVIARSMRSLLLQDYPGVFSVILVDDHSTDGTAVIAAQALLAVNCGPRLSIITARDLPRGWSGKVWAQSEGVIALEARAAESAFVWFTDADIEHGPHVLRELVARAEAEGLDLTSLMVRLRSEAVAERALIPAFVFFFAMLYPFAWVNDARRRTAAAAGGCMLVRHSALRRIGGMARIADALIDDCTLAAAIKVGGAIRLDLATSSASIRPYASWRSIWDMIARSAFTQLRHSSRVLAGTVAGLLATYLAPPLLPLLFGLQAWPALIAWLLMALAYLPMLRYYRAAPLWALLLPLVALFYLAATLDSARRYWSGTGGQWKGRTQAPRRDA